MNEDEERERERRALNKFKNNTFWSDRFISHLIFWCHLNSSCLFTLSTISLCILTCTENNRIAEALKLSDKYDGLSKFYVPLKSH